MKRRDLLADGETTPLRVHLHELAECLQSASFYIETLKTLAQRSNDKPPIEGVVIDKAQQQLDRAKEGFQVLCQHLFWEENGPPN